MRDQANALRGLIERRVSRASDAPKSAETTRAHTIVVTSGKGGVGKSNIALNLAIALSAGQTRVCLLDANLGLGNIDLLCGLNGYWNLAHVITGARRLVDVMLTGPGGIHLIPGASGLSDVADCPPSAQQDLFKQLEEVELTHDFVVIDTGTGIHRSVRQFVTAADIVLIVATPEPTSVADAYATVKALSNEDVAELEVVINQAESTQQARSIIERLQQTARMFLKAEVGGGGSIPHDHHVMRAVVRRTPLLIDSPHCPAARAIQQLACRMKNMTARSPSRGGFFPRVWQRTQPKAA